MASTSASIMMRKQVSVIPTLSRLLHQSSSQTYQINYEQLRAGKDAGAPNAGQKSDLMRNLPNTVTSNVKSIQGWRGGAERGFRAVYTDFIHVLTKETTKDIPDLAKWYRKVLTHNLSPNVLKNRANRYGILVPITYKQLNPTASKDEMNLAHILGWCVEMIRASSVMTTETIGVNQSYGRRKVDRETWAEKHDLGNKAFNDALLVERGVFVLLKHYFGDQAYIYFDAVTHAQRVRTLGRALGYSLLENDDVENRLKEYTFRNLKALDRSHFSQTNFCLPISLALHLAGMHEEKLHELAHAILHEIGSYVELNHDFHNCYLDPQGSDIEDGRLTFLIVLALQRANPEQKKLLNANYGCCEPEKSEIVKQIYNDLKLEKILATQIKNTEKDIHSRIQGISKLDKAGLSQEFFFKLMENMDMNNIS